MKKIFAILIVVAGMATPALAATDLLQVYKQALVGDQTFQAARGTYLAATEAYPQALAALLPTIGLAGTASSAHTKIFDSFPGTANASGNLQGYTYTLSISQPVINFGNWFGLHVASYGVKQASATYAAAAQDLIVRTAQAYFNVLNAEDNLRYILAEKEATWRQLDQAKQQYEVGLEAITSVYDAQASYDTTVSQAIAAQNNVENTEEQLRQITGVLYTNLATLKQQMPLLTPNPNNVTAWVEKSDRYNFQLQAARFAMEQARENIKVSFSGHLPTLNLNGTSDRTSVGNPSEGIAGSANNLVNTVGLTLNLPIYQGGLINSQVRQAQFNFQTAIANLENTHLTVSTSLRQTYNSIISGISKIQADEQAVVSQQASLESTEAALKVGTRTIVDLLLAQQQLFQAQSTLATDEYTYINNTLAFKQLAGTLSYKDLQAINTWLQGRGRFKSPYKSDIDVEKLIVTTANSKPTGEDQVLTNLSKIASIPSMPEARSTTHAKTGTKPSKKPSKAQPIKSSSAGSGYTHGYTIQLMADPNQSTVSQFVKQNNLSAATSIQETKVRNRSWYALWYGNYKTATAAKAAMANLPGNLKRLNPWIRPVH